MRLLILAREGDRRGRRGCCEGVQEPAAAAVAPPVAAEGEGAPAGSDTFYLEQVTLDESDDEYNDEHVPGSLQHQTNGLGWRYLGGCETKGDENG